MTFKWENQIIKSYRYGYVAKIKIGKQWQIEGYYPTLEQAILGLFNARVLTEMDDYVVDATKKASIALKTSQIVQRINDIKDEILEGIQNGE